MITSLTLKNFKSIENETYSFTDLDLLVGMNNSGKSTILQALAIWQYCVDEFARSDRKGKRGVQIVLPNFSALPLPEFNLLWRNKIDRQYPQADGGKKQEFILIEIDVRWDTPEGKEENFGVSLRYQSPQVVYSSPGGGWERFRELHQNGQLPKIVYVPPFSGLEPNEEWRDDSILKRQVGKAQPGSVLRNLLYRVVDKKEEDWEVIETQIEKLFSIRIKRPIYEKGVDIQITCNYEQNRKTFDIIVGGSGFHQMLTLLAFMFGYDGVTTILLDEPDAHMHANLQREMVGFLKTQSMKKNIQFIIATHSEELINGVDTTRIISILKTKPERVSATPKIITALSDVSNLEVTGTKESAFILYIEGESDERILKAWAMVLEKNEILNKFYIRTMGGGSKEKMREESDRHFEGLRQIVPGVKRFMLFDYDTDKTAFHPTEDNPNLYEWKRKNIENYFLIKDLWHRTSKNQKKSILNKQDVTQVIDDFFESENLTLPKNAEWKTVDANIFKVVDGKKILFEDEDSLFQRLKKLNPGLNFNKETIAANMLETEIHKDIVLFFEKLEALVGKSKPSNNLETLE